MKRFLYIADVFQYDHNNMPTCMICNFKCARMPAFIKWVDTNIQHDGNIFYQYCCVYCWPHTKWNLIGHKYATKYLAREFPDVPRDIWLLIETFCQLKKKR